MSTSMYNTFRTDGQAEIDGIVLEYENFRVTIARAGGANKEFKKCLEEETAPHQRMIQNDVFTNDQAEDLLQRVYSKKVVRNWETKISDGSAGFHWESGIENPDGGDLIPFTADAVLAVFKALPDLYMDIRDQAQKSALFRVSLREEAAKNS